MNPSPSWNITSDIDQLLAYPFMVNALEAGTIVAILAGVVGWFMVLRSQSFAGHTLAVMAFPGGAAAALAGLPIVSGYYVACTVAAIAIAAVKPNAGQSYSAESAAIGTVQTAGLALGFLFLSLYNGVLGGLESLLFGTFLGITQAQVLTLLLVAASCLAVLAIAGRPLLFASVDPRAAQARGLPVRFLSAGFLLLLALAVAATSQITGALLVFALLVAPAATAQTITTRPGLGMLLSVSLAVLITWMGLGIAYFSPYPVGFFVTSLAFGTYLSAHGAVRIRRRLAFPRPTI